MFETRNVIAEIFSIAGAIRQQCTSNLVFRRGRGDDWICSIYGSRIQP